MTLSVYVDLILHSDTQYPINLKPQNIYIFAPYLKRIELRNEFIPKLAKKIY
jgi:hypothetical protein